MTDSLVLVSRLFAHLRWADQRVLAALRVAEPPAEALELYAHVLGSEEVWLSRIEERPATAAVWPRLAPDEIPALAARTHAGYEALLAGGDGRLAREVDYRNSAGKAFRSAVLDILLHVALHGSYHRGQIASLLRRSGAAPASTDYIAFVRGAPAATRPSGGS